MWNSCPEHLAVGTWRDLRIEVARDPAVVKDAWSLEDARLVGYVFQSYRWLELWQDCVGAPEGLRPLPVRVADAAGRTLLFLPLGIRRAGGVRTLLFMGGKVADYHAPRIDAGFAAACTASGFAGLWARDPAPVAAGGHSRL